MLLNIFCPSWNINKIKYIIPSLFKSNDSLGLNWFNCMINKELDGIYGKGNHPICKKWMTMDSGNPFLHLYSGEEILASIDADNFLKSDFSQYPKFVKVTDEYQFGIKPSYIFGYSDTFLPEEKTKHVVKGTVLCAAIDYAIKQNYSKVVLFAGLTPEWEYFDSRPSKYIKKNIAKEQRKIERIKGIISELSGHIKIYKAFKETPLDIEYINPVELL